MCTLLSLLLYCYNHEIDIEKEHPELHKSVLRIYGHYKPHASRMAEALDNLKLPSRGDIRKAAHVIQIAVMIDELTQEGLWVVQEAASRLSECNEGGISVSGHTDSVGAAKYNLDLSKRRAYTVASVLVQMGIQKDRLQAQGFGETRPIDTNDTPEGRSQNRRVELVVQ